MQDTHYLYKIVRRDGKSYVGVSKNPEARLDQHICGLGNNELYGRSGLILTILNKGPKKYIYELEKTYISIYNPELNKAPGGIGGDTGFSAKGEKQGLSKLKDADIVTIRTRMKNGENYREIAKEFNVAHSTIYSLCIGKTWKHLGGPLTKFRNASEAKNINIKKSRILKDKGMTTKEIAIELKVSERSVRRYLNDNTFL